MGMIKFLTDGSWWVSSESDPRWNGGGHSSDVGMFQAGGDSTSWIAKCEGLYGDRPDDLVVGYMKD